MNDAQNKISESAEMTEVRLHCEDLRRQGNLLMIGLVVVSLIVTAYLGLQVRRTGKDLDVIRPNATPVIEATKKQEPVIKNFLLQVEEYGKKHPQFAQQVLAKYGTKAMTNQAPLPGAGLPGK